MDSGSLGRTLGSMTTLPGTTEPSAPWFRAYPKVALWVAALLYGVVLVVRLQSGSVVDGYSMLYVFPVALVAMASGARAGLAAGLVAVALIVVWVLVRDVSLGPVAWASRVLPLLLLGVLLGDASDRLRRADAARRRLEAAALIHREAVEINDSIVQGMVTAKWSLEAGQVDAGLDILTATITRAQELVSSLIRQAAMGSRSLTLDATTSPSDPGGEDHDALHRHPM